jgi:hypothetical protein
MDRVIVTCTDCERVYTARQRDDESLILPTTDGCCECRSSTFVAFDDGEGAAR